MFEDLEEFAYERDPDVVDNEAVWNNGTQTNPNGPEHLPDLNCPNDVTRKRQMSLSLIDDDQLDWHMRIDLNDQFGDGEDGKIKRRKFHNEIFIQETIDRLQRIKNDIYTSTLHKITQMNEEESQNLNAVRLLSRPPTITTTLDWSSIRIRDRYFYILAQPDLTDVPSKNRDDKYRNMALTSGLIKNFDKIILHAEEKIKTKESIPMDSEPLFPEMDTVLNDRILWVEKYRARFYTDLLSDDGVNRTLLTWLKLWDECVFKIERPKPKQQQSKMPLSRNDNSYKFNRNGQRPYKKPFMDSDDLPIELDKYKRPQHKIALMCGTPGVGKTTLAHVCAQHCGYFVCEMNASDDRTLDAFRKQLEVVTQMSATLDGRKKPHCLIIDEIDGAPAASINYLISFAKHLDDANGKNQQILRRPIICICNDLYVPALTELRKVALVLHVPPIEIRRLSDRLNMITKRENITCDSTAFELLCEKTERDVRSCLNTLQFLSLKSIGATEDAKTSKISSNEIRSESFGLKDAHKTLFAVWGDIFRLPKFTRKRHQDVFETINHTTIAARFKNIGNTIDSCGEIDKVVEGVFTNYINVSFKDPSLKLINHGLSWLQMIDKYDRHIEETQSYDFWAYKKYLPILFHLSFASAAQIRLSYPQVFSETSNQRIKYLGLLNTLMDHMAPLNKAFVSAHILLHELCPYLVRIIQPNLKPINSQLYSESDRNEMEKVVQIMIDYNLTYRQERNVEGRYEFILEPPLDEMLTLKSSTSNEHILILGKKLKKLMLMMNVIEGQNLKEKWTLPYVAKQLISREIEIRKNKTKHREENAVLQKNNQTNQKKLIPENRMPNFESQKAQGQPMINAFWKKNPANTEDEEASSDESSRTAIWFKFKEGSMNAVRRTLKISDLL